MEISSKMVLLFTSYSMMQVKGKKNLYSKIQKYG